MTAFPEQSPDDAANASRPPEASETVPTASFFAPTSSSSSKRPRPESLSSVSAPAAPPEHVEHVEADVYMADYGDLMSNDQLQGWPDVNDLEPQGPGEMITRLLGYSDAEGFREPSLGDWPHPAWDFDILPPTFEAEPIVPKLAAEGDAPPTDTPFVKPTLQEMQQARPHPHAFLTRAGWHVATPWPPSETAQHSLHRDAITPCPALTDLASDSADAAARGLGHHFCRKERQVSAAHIYPPDSEDSSYSHRNYLGLYYCTSPGDALALAYTETDQACGTVLGWAQEFEASKMQHPPLDASPELGLAMAWDNIWRILDDFIFRGNVQAIRIEGKTFIKRIGWDETIQRLWQSIGFKEAHGKLKMPTFREDSFGQRRRALLQAWVEVGIHALTARQKLRPNESMPPTSSRISQCLRILPARDTIAPMLGGNPFKPVKRSSVWTSVGSKPQPDIDEAFKFLGCTPTDSDALIVHAYHQQVRVAPGFTPGFLAALQRIVDHTGSDELQIACVSVRSQDVYSTDDVSKALAEVGIEASIDLRQRVKGDGAALEEEQLAERIEPHFVAETDPAKRKRLREAYALIARFKDSGLMHAVLNSVTPAEETNKPRMSLDRAYELLSCNKESPDDLVQACFGMMVEDLPAKKDDLKEAVKVIAEERNSAFLRHFAETGEALDPRTWVEAPPAVSSDRPVGLENIGNTCYLSSLLQYFFIFPALRDVILQYEDFVEESDALAVEKRVGGRVVSAAEIKRSKKFVKHLSTLYSQLIHASSTSIRPEKELAYLALVTSQDEQEEQVQPAAATDQDGSSMPPLIPVEPQQSSTAAPMEVEEQASLEATSGLVRAPGAEVPTAGDVEMPQRTASPQQSEQPLIATEGTDGVTEIGPMPDPSSKPPPLPPRPQPHKQSTTYGGDMMFGKQHDVSEAMDNVMFQIEAALDPAKVQQRLGISSIVHSLFYGKSQQVLRIEGQEEQSSRKMEESFSYLLVNVADGGQSIYEGLNSSFQETEVEIEGKKAKRQVFLTQAPQVLQIQLQRVQFDPATARAFKSNAWMSFPPTVKLDRYFAFDPADDTASARHEMTKAVSTQLSEKRRDLARMLEDESGPESKSIPDQLAIIANADAVQTSLAELSADLLSESESLRTQRADTQEHIDELQSQLDQLWADSNEAEYELSSAFMHRGAASYGHYWLHQRALPDQGERWIKFNDAQVTDLTPPEVLEPSLSDPTANPYWLTYVRKGSGLVQAVCRQI